MAELIKTDRLKKHFGDIAAVDGISLSVRQGEVLGFLGPNGAGEVDDDENDHRVSRTRQRLGQN